MGKSSAGANPPAKTRKNLGEPKTYMGDPGSGAKSGPVHTYYDLSIRTDYGRGTRIDHARLGHDESRT